MTAKQRKVLRLRPGVLRIGSVLHDVSTSGSYPAPIVIVPPPSDPINSPTNPGPGYLPPGAIDPWVGPVPIIPNLLLNSDFARRSVFGLSMAESFTDAVAWTAQTGTLGTVSGNILTAGSTGAWRATWNGPTSMWREGRWSVAFKAVDVGAVVYRLEKWIDSNNLVYCGWAGGTFEIVKKIAGSVTSLGSVAQALTLNRWYWLELECQGSSYRASIYDTGGTVAGVTKAASTLLASLGVFTASDTAVVSGGIALESTATTASQWGGVATVNCGVYVEIWQPESWTVSLGGTLGGQAIGFDESTDCGPINQQAALRVFLPKENRFFKIQQFTPNGSIMDRSAYIGSVYTKLVSLGSGTATLGNITFTLQTIFQTDVSAGGAGLYQDSVSVTSADSSSWVQKNTRQISWTTTARACLATINDGAGFSAFTNALFEIQLIQFENLPTATAWRNNPADFATINWALTSPRDLTTTSATAAEMDPRDLACVVSLPWDAIVEVTQRLTWKLSAAGTAYASNYVDGSIDATVAVMNAAAATSAQSIAPVARMKLSAGKHRIAMRASTTAGTLTYTGASDFPIAYLIAATRGK